MSGTFARVRGVDEARRLLSQIAPREARSLIVATVHDVAQTLVDEAKQGMPVETGKMRSATKANKEKADGNRARSTVRVSRRAFYWRFLEDGDGPDHIEYAMFLRAFEKVRSNLDRVFVDAFSRKLISRLIRAKGKGS